jgi:Flp pilus assembly protein TadG
MLKSLVRLRKKNDGVAAVEFALIAPVLITMLLGSIELTNALECHQKVTNLAASTADLVAQVTQVSNADMQDIFSSVNQILYPFPTTNNPQITVSSLTYKTATTATVAWSMAQNTTQRGNGTIVTIPAGLFPPNPPVTCSAKACSLILAEVKYNYTSPLGKLIIGTLPMTDTFYAKPRQSPTVALTP